MHASLIKQEEKSWTQSQVAHSLQPPGLTLVPGQAEKIRLLLWVIRLQ
jgi:hypothetical protein